MHVIALLLVWTTTDINLYDYIPRWGFPNLFSGVDKTLNKVGGITPLHLRRKQSYALNCLVSNILWSDYVDSFLKPCMQWYFKHYDNNWRIRIKIMRPVFFFKFLWQTFFNNGPFFGQLLWFVEKYSNDDSRDASSNFHIWDQIKFGNLRVKDSGVHARSIFSPKASEPPSGPGA